MLVKRSRAAKDPNEAARRKTISQPHCMRRKCRLVPSWPRNRILRYRSVILVPVTGAFTKAKGFGVPLSTGATPIAYEMQQVDEGRKYVIHRSVREKRVDERGGEKDKRKGT